MEFALGLSSVCHPRTCRLATQIAPNAYAQQVWAVSTMLYQSCARHSSIRVMRQQGVSRRIDYKQFAQFAHGQESRRSKAVDVPNARSVFDNCGPMTPVFIDQCSTDVRVRHTTVEAGVANASEEELCSGVPLPRSHETICSCRKVDRQVYTPRGN